MARNIFTQILKNKHKKVWIAVAVLGVFALAIFAYPIKYTAIEEYTETQQYSDNDCHYENLKYNVDWIPVTSNCINNVCAEYQTVCTSYFLGICTNNAQQCARYACLQYTGSCGLSIQNIDSEEGTFSLNGYIIKSDNSQTNPVPLSVNIRPSRTETLTWSASLTQGDFPFKCSYDSFSVPSKQVCNPVIRSREVTKTRPVTKTTTWFDKWTGKTSYRFDQYGNGMKASP